MWVLPDNPPGKQLLLLEVDGGIYSGGRHVRGAGYEKDCEKLNLAAVEGYTVLRVTKKHLLNGDAMRWVRQCLFGKDLPELPESQ